jgi:hypothetical protein
MIVVVLCGHRTGSSAVAGFLHNMGVHMGNDLLGANPTNPKGHFEDREFVMFGENFLRFHKGNWHQLRRLQSPSQPHPSELAEFRSIVKRKDKIKHLWGWKDPRTVIYIRGLYHVLKDPFFIWVHRPREATIKSLSIRNRSFDEEKSGIIYDYHLNKWEVFKKEVLEVKFPNKYTVVPYNDLLERPEVYVALFTQLFKLPLTKKPFDFLDISLNHHLKLGYEEVDDN